jgi:extradiol dioxygenase family protein
MLDSMSLPPFHLAFPVTDLEATRTFFCDLLDCGVGRESESWIDFDFFGHQITAHLIAPPSGRVAIAPAGENPVDGKQVPVPHFGAVLSWEKWHAMADRLARAGVAFVIAPHVRFPGQVGEQATMFFRDPSGNPIELKSFKDPARLFAS